MISKSMETALNKQINEELASEYLYMSMSAYFESVNLSGFAQWMKAQADEERAHAMKIYNFVFERGGKVVLMKLDAPKAKWTTPLNAFEDAYKHEVYITKCITNLSKLASKENDLATVSFLNWFIDEQVEEEKSIDAVVQKLKMIKGAPGGIYMLDRELSSRSSLNKGENYGRN